MFSYTMSTVSFPVSISVSITTTDETTWTLHSSIFTAHLPLKMSVSLYIETYNFIKIEATLYSFHCIKAFF